MTGWFEVLTIAFVAQLAVLPGEKVQFIIAGLSTRYNPALVVAAAGSAFAGWTALEILFGRALQQALSPLVLDGLTGALFLLFAVLLFRSAPARGAPAEADGGITGVADDVEFPTILGYDIPERFGGFLPIFAMMAFGEFGDKTQLITIGLAVQYGATSAIWVGEMLAIIPVSIANAYFFHRFSHRLNLRKAHLTSAALFAFFAADVALKLVTGFSVWEQAVATVSNALLAAL
ncbi:TMEM165/GDT1 family protein [Haloplanus sp. GCM10025708]|uniref:TMEM165/GDT1 family protein n=1 Tax=Haloferacaceae TaxID=1644056 RepID=UPI00361174D1